MDRKSCHKNESFYIFCIDLHHIFLARSVKFCFCNIVLQCCKAFKRNRLFIKTTYNRPDLLHSPLKITHIFFILYILNQRLHIHAKYIFQRSILQKSIFSKTEICCWADSTVLSTEHSQYCFSVVIYVVVCAIESRKIR